MKTFAVLGGGGFVGYRLSEYLVLHELAIPRPIVRGFRSMARLSRFDLDIRLADACDVPALVDALTGCDVAFHCVVGDNDHHCSLSNRLMLLAAKPACNDSCT